ncbi:MAG: pilus assembly protein TadG-related protein [bacterium]
MRKRLQLMLGLSDERGATVIIVGIMIPVFIGLASLAVDVGYSMVTRNELQNIADGAALAATGQLGVNYESISTDDLINYDVSGDEETFIKGVAKDVASNNQAGGVGDIIINDNDIEIGKWDTDSRTFTPTLELPNAVRVITRREEGINGPLHTFFAGVFGQNDVAINATATAALTGIDQIAPCELFWPVGISAAWFDYWNETTGSWCDQNIRMYPTGDIEGCAGWHTFESWPSNASKLAQILQEKINGGCSDGYETGDPLVYTGGTVASVFDDMKALWEWGRMLNDGEIDLDTDDATWTTIVVIYGLDDCSNPSGEIPIVGFATIAINQVLEMPDKIINATVKCLDFEEGRGGGGGAYGTMGTIPGLVQ